MPQSRHRLVRCKCILASVFRSALTFTSPNVSRRVLAFVYDIVSPGLLISALPFSWTKVSPTVLVFILITVSAQVFTILLTYTPPSVLIITSIFTLCNSSSCFLVCASPTVQARSQLVVQLSDSASAFPSILAFASSSLW